MRRRLLIFLLSAMFMLVNFALSRDAKTVHAAENDNAEEKLGQTVDELLGEIDTSELDKYLNSLTDSQKKLFGADSIADKLGKIVSGESAINYGNFFMYFLEMAGVSITRYLPFMISILVICIAFSLISSMKGKLSSDSVESVVHFACLALVVVLCLTEVTRIITSVVKMIGTLKYQMNIIFPIILTMMAASGAVSSAAVYQPSVAILAGGITEVISSLIVPFFIMSVVFTVVGSISKGIKLKKMSGFFASASKWLLGTIFFVFAAFLSIQGITASVYDGVSVRTAKFAISKYVPIIGGYLSEGMNLVMAGSVLVKNAVGMTAVIMLFISFAPIILDIILLSLTLNLTAAIVEPLGNSEAGEMLSGLSKNISMLIAIVLGTVFLYFIFLVLVIATGNVAL